MALYGFAETTKSNLIQLEDPKNIVFTSILLHIMASEISYLNNGGADGITATTGSNEEHHDATVIPTDEVDQHGRQIYEMSYHHDNNNSKFNKNKYYPWTNEDDFWITE